MENMEPMIIDYKQQNTLLVEKRKRLEKRARVMFVTGCAALILGLTVFGISLYKSDDGESIIEQTAEASTIYTPVIQETPVEEVPVEVDTVVEYTEPDISELYRDEIVYIAKTVYGEARGCSKTEQAAVIWSILNRVDSELPYMPDDIIGVVTQAHQYVGYNSKHPVTDEFVDLAKDVLSRWVAEKNGETNVGRVLPKNYLWFYGDGKHNHFTDEWRNGNKWDWNLESPYEM